MFTQNFFDIILKCSIVRVFFVDLRWAQLYVSLVVSTLKRNLLFFFCKMDSLLQGAWNLIDDFRMFVVLWMIELRKPWYILEGLERALECSQTLWKKLIEYGEILETFLSIDKSIQHSKTFFLCIVAIFWSRGWLWGSAWQISWVEQSSRVGLDFKVFHFAKFFFSIRLIFARRVNNSKPEIAVKAMSMHPWL